MRDLFAGSHRADSLVTNPHKWLFTPFDLSAFYCRHMDVLRRAFSLTPEYLRTSEAETVHNHMDYGIQLGRRFRALKLWMVIRYFGHEGLAARIREHCRLAHLFAAWVDEARDWELLAPVHFSLVCFRARPLIIGEAEEARAARLDALNETLMNNLNATGRAYLSHTRLNGVFPCGSPSKPSHDRGAHPPCLGTLERTGRVALLIEAEEPKSVRFIKESVIKPRRSVYSPFTSCRT